MLGVPESWGQISKVDIDVLYARPGQNYGIRPRLDIAGVVYLDIEHGKSDKNGGNPGLTLLRSQWSVAGGEAIFREYMEPEAQNDNYKTQSH